MNNKSSNQYDEIKVMLKTLRTLNESAISKKKSLFEQEEQGQQQSTEPIPGDDNPDVTDKQFNDVDVINDVEVKILSPDQEDIVLKDFEKTEITKLIDSFREQVSQIADLSPGISISEGQVRLDGTLTDLDISFVFIAGNDAGLYLNSDMLKIENESVEMITKLLRFEQTFKDSMAPLIRDRQST